MYVNGEKITKRDFETLMFLKDKIWRLGQNLPLEITEDEVPVLTANAGPSIIMELIHRTMFRQYAKEIGAVPKGEAVRACEKGLLKAINRSNDTISGLAVMIGGREGEIFRQIPYMDARDAVLRQSVTTNDLDSVSDAEIERRLAYVEKFDANADAQNDKARKRLLEAKARILAGASFAEEAKKIADTVNPQYGKAWGDFEIQEFPADEELHKWLLTAKAGDISDPVDVEDGLAIVKVLDKHKGAAPPGHEPPDAFTLVRCTVKACEKMRYQDREEMSRQLLLWKREDAQRKLGMMLTGRAVIEYPNGTNLFDNAAAKAAGEEK